MHDKFVLKIDQAGIVNANVKLNERFNFSFLNNMSLNTVAEYTLILHHTVTIIIQKC